MRLWIRGRKDGPWCLDVAGVVGQENKQGSMDRRKLQVRFNPMDLQRLGRVGCTVVRWMSVPLSVASPRVQCGSRVHGLDGNWAVKADAVIRGAIAGVVCQERKRASRVMADAAGSANGIMKDRSRPLIINVLLDLETYSARVHAILYICTSSLTLLSGPVRYYHFACTRL